MFRLQAELARILISRTFTTRMTAHLWHRLKWRGNDGKFNLMRTELAMQSMRCFVYRLEPDRFFDTLALSHISSD
jgi:hypothetical protein